MKWNTCDSRRLDLFLRDRLPADDQRELEAHLSVCPACRGRLDDWAGGADWWTEVRQHLGGDGAAELQRPVGSAHAALKDLYFLQPSDRAASLGRLGLYEVLEILGRGGFGIVLKAFDPSLHRPVAIKVLAPEFAVSGAARKRFVREAQATAAVSHDHVVPVHAVEPDATPPYLVMAFIHGQSLQQRIDRGGPLELKEVLRIGMQTAAGLAAAHAQGLVHRDIKPANIMLENGIERVRITDFGLARAVDDASVSQSGALSGTPQYMSPEQATCATVDQRSDLFALGSTLYAMCTGRPPFRGSPCLAVLKQVCESEPPPIRSLNADVPAWLEGIIRKLHAKDPARRFGSAAEVADLLERCLAHVQQPDRQPLPSEAAALGHAQRPRRRHGVALVLLLTTIIGGGYLYLHRSGAPEATSLLDPGDLNVASPPAGDFGGDTTERAQAMRAEVDQLWQHLRGPAPESDPLEGRLFWLRQRLNGVGQGLQHSADGADPVEASIEQLRGRVEKVRARLQRLNQGGDFSESSFNQPIGVSR